MGSSFGIISQTGNNIQTKGLILYNDPAYHKCFVTESLNSFNLAINPKWQNFSGSLTPTGSLVSGIEWTSSYGGVWVFDGVDERISFSSTEVSSNQIFREQTFTIEAWINSPLDKAYNCIWSYDYSSNSSPYYAQHLRTQGSSTIYFGYNIAGSGENLNGSSQITANNWIHVAITRDNSTGLTSLYTHDKESSRGDQWYKVTETVSGDITYYDQTAQIGEYLTGTNQDFKGMIGPFRFYNRVLSQDELQQNHDAEKNRFGL
jgi:hypothetical protein